MDSLTTRQISVHSERISNRAQDLRQNLITYGQLGHLPTRQKALMNINALRTALDEAERLLSEPRYPGDTLGKPVTE